MEPYTWAWFGEKIAGGLVSGAAAQLLASLSGENLQASIRDAITSLVPLLKDVVDGVVRDDAIRQCSALADSIYNAITDYEASPSTRDFQLNSATDDVNKLIAQYLSLGLYGFQGLVVASGMELTIIQERIKRFGDGEKAVYNEARDRNVTSILTYPDKFYQWNVSRFGPVINISPPGPHQQFGYTLDNVLVTFPIFSLREQADANRSARISEEKQKI